MSIDTNRWIEVINKARLKGISDQEIVDLTLELAKSGAIENFEFGRTADFASTGGPSSISTLLTPLFLVQLGFIVPKLGVPGRPAGGLDVLAQIPNYRIDLSQHDLEAALRKGKYAHFISSGRYAPLDLEVFRLRQKNNAQSVPALVIASILSKKVALGIKDIGLDIRIAKHGNFGSNYSAGRKNAEQFIRIAKMLSCNAVCVLTDANIPYQPYIGRGEALWSLYQIFNSTSDSWLMKHVHQCARMTTYLSSRGSGISTEDLKNIFIENLNVQGADYEMFLDRVAMIKDQHSLNIDAQKTGFLNYNLRKIREVIVGVQQLFKSDDIYPDPCGVKLLIHPAEKVESGQTVMTVRIPDSLKKEYRDKFSQCFEFLDKPQRILKDEVVYG